MKNLEFDGNPLDAGDTEILTEIGFIVKQTPKMVVLVGERDISGKSVRWSMSIPAKLVRQITELVPKNGE